MKLSIKLSEALLVAHTGTTLLEISCTGLNLYLKCIRVLFDRTTIYNIFKWYKLLGLSVVIFFF